MLSVTHRMRYMRIKRLIPQKNILFTLRFRHKMTFESLASELILDLFYSFYNLNSRYNTLLLKHFRVCHLNFQSISKRNFDSICQQQLPFILNQIIFVGFHSRSIHSFKIIDTQSYLFI